MVRSNKCERVINESSKRTRLSRRRADDDDDSQVLQKFSESGDDLVVQTKVMALSKLLKEAIMEQHLHLPFPTEVESEFDRKVVDDNGADKQVSESTTVSVPSTKALTKDCTS